jgi:hypothetical protein
MAPHVHEHFNRRYQGLWSVKHGHTERQVVISWDADRRQYLVTLSGGAMSFYLRSATLGRWLKGRKGRRVHP